MGCLLIHRLLFYPPTKKTSKKRREKRHYGTNIRLQSSYSLSFGKISSFHAPNRTKKHRVVERAEDIYFVLWDMANRQL